MYVPEKDGAPLENSGPTIASGFDLGQRDSLSEYGLSKELEAKLKPYLGKKRAEAVKFVAENPLTLSEDEILEINKKVKSKEVTKVRDKFNEASEIDFDSLPVKARTAIVSVLFQYGSPSKVPTFWKHVTSGNWTSAEAELLNFGDNYSTRRGLEAELVEQSGLSSLIKATSKKRKP